MRYKTALKMEHIFPPRNDGLCRRCQKPLQGKQRKWCSDCPNLAFEEMMFAKGSSTHIRRALLTRDRGICAGCGCDTEKMGRVRKHARISAQKPATETDRKIFNFDDNEAIFQQFQNGHGSFWEADHIIEVVNGGQHTLENLATLCISCHKKKTRSLHRKFEKIKFENKTLPLFEVLK